MVGNNSYRNVLLVFLTVLAASYAADVVSYRLDSVNVKY